MITQRVALRDVHLAGAYAAVRPRAPFFVGPVILRLAPTRLLQVMRYEEGHAEGLLLEEAEFDQLVAIGDATRCDAGIPAEPGLVAWALRNDLPGVDTLLGDLDEAAAVARRILSRDGPVLFVRQAAAMLPRAEASARCVALARGALERGEPVAARLAASAAWSLALPVTPLHTALYVVALERVGSVGRAAALQRAEQESRGEEFGVAASRLADRLRGELSTAPAPRSVLLEGRRTALLIRQQRVSQLAQNSRVSMLANLGAPRQLAQGAR